MAEGAAQLTKLPSVREAARRRWALDGTDAQALEHALTQAEADCTTWRAHAEALADILRHWKCCVMAPQWWMLRAQDALARLPAQALAERRHSSPALCCGCTCGRCGHRGGADDHTTACADALAERGVLEDCAVLLGESEDLSARIPQTREEQLATWEEWHTRKVAALATLDAARGGVSSE